MNPDEVADKEFPVVMRGYSRDEVDAYLTLLADDLAERDSRLARLQLELTRLQAGPAVPPTVDRPSLLRQLGEEAASILACADASAERIKADALMTTERVRHDLRSIGNSLGDVHQLLGELVSLVQGLGEHDSPVGGEVRIPDGALPLGGDLPGSEVRTILGEVLGLDTPPPAEIHLPSHDSELRRSGP